MNRDVIRTLGMGKSIDTLELGKCPFCGERVKMKEFRDEVSVREFKLNGLCQGCQDEMFEM